MVRKKSSYDDLETDYFDEEVGGSFLSLMSLGVAFLAVAAFIALAWYAYQGDGATDGEMETIYAQEGDIRNAPEGESGWQFPDAERQVYNLGNGDVEDMQVEQILPQPTRPQAREPVQETTEGWINNQQADTGSDDGSIGITDAERRKLQEIANANIQKAPEVVVQAKEKQAVEAAIIKSAKVKQVAKIAKPKPVAAPAPSKAPVVKAKKSSASLTRNRLQLGAFGSRSEALKNWGKIKSKSSSLLGSKKAHIEQATVKGKTYYRVQAYPFSSKSKADALCVMLKSRNQPCFSVKR